MCAFLRNSGKVRYQSWDPLDHCLKPGPDDFQEPLSNDKMKLSEQIGKPFQNSHTGKYCPFHPRSNWYGFNLVHSRTNWMKKAGANTIPSTGCFDASRDIREITWVVSGNQKFKKGSVGYSLANCMGNCKIISVWDTRSSTSCFIRQHSADVISFKRAI